MLSARINTLHDACRRPQNATRCAGRGDPWEPQSEVLILGDYLFAVRIPRRTRQLVRYQISCGQKELGEGLGQPDYHPITPDAPELLLSKDHLQHGYKESYENICTEAEEVTLSLLDSCSAPVFTVDDYVKHSQVISSACPAVRSLLKP